MADEDRPSAFLPPEPAGPEPELGVRPEPPVEPGGWDPPAGAQPPPPAAPQAPPVQQWQGQAGWPPAPPPAQSQGWSAPPGQPYVWAPAPPQPDNGSAVAGLVLSLVAGGLLIVSFGLSSLVSVGCAIAGILQSRKGQRKIRAGETAKHEGVAQAGVIIGWISLVLAVLATVAWILIGILYATNESFQDDLDRELENSDSVEAVVRAAVASVRAGAHLLG